MADLGKQGGKAASPTKQPAEGGTPANTGNQSAPRSDKMLFENPRGIGGTTPGAH